MSANTKVNILFITRRFPPSVGGMERFAADLYDALSKKVNIRLIKWGGSNKLLPIVLPIFFVRACWILITSKVDVIHMQDGLQAPMGVVLKIIFRKPLVVVIHGLDITYQNSLYQTVIPRTLKRADHVICISHTAMEEVTKRGVPKAKVSFVPLGITDDLKTDKVTARSRVILKLSLDQDTKIVLSAGRLVKRKGVEWFIRNVLAELIKANAHIVFVVSGEGPEQAAVKQAVKQLGLGNNVQLLGRTSNEFLRDLYNGSDVFVMPNISVPGDMEGFGRVLLEAALCELPVVASGIEGITDAIIDGQNGVLVKEKNAAAFIAEINKVLKNPAKAHQHGKKARQFTLRNFSWDKIAQQYLDQYQKLLT